MERSHDEDRASKQSPAAQSEGQKADQPPAGMFSGPWYYSAQYLHRRPSPLRPIWPVYPAEAETVRGHVILLLLINEQGKVDQSRIESADPAGIFEASVIKAFTSAAYAPALIAGYKVKSQLRAEVFFEPGAPPRANFSIMETAKPVQGAGGALGGGN